MFFFVILLNINQLNNVCFYNIFFLCRFEIEKKLKRAKKKEIKEQKSLDKILTTNNKNESSYSTNSIPLDLKDRVKERKKNIEKNKFRDEKKTAMTLLKARRDEKRERGIIYFNLYEHFNKIKHKNFNFPNNWYHFIFVSVEEKEKEKKKDLEKKIDDESDDQSDQNQTKLKASDIYSDDSNSSSDSLSSDDEPIEKPQSILDSDSDTTK